MVLRDMSVRNVHIIHFDRTADHKGLPSHTFIHSSSLGQFCHQLWCQRLIGCTGMEITNTMLVEFDVRHLDV